MLLITKPVAISSFSLSYNSIHTFSFPPDVSIQGSNYPIVSHGLLLKKQTCLIKFITCILVTNNSY